VGIVGESGCGKSVTMRAVLQIVEPPGRVVGGSMLFSGEGGRVVDLARLDPRGTQMRAIRGAEIALIPQEPMAAFSPVHTVGDQVIEALRLHQLKWRPHGPGLTKTEARQMTVELFHDVGISMPGERVDAYAWQLSGGLRQRAMIAMALSCDPRLLLADEPTTALDATVQVQVLILLRKLQRDLGMGMIFVTHDLGVAAEIADTIAVMYAGRIVEIGPVAQVLRAPLHPYTAGLLASTVHGQERDRDIDAIPGSPPDMRQLSRGCSFAPRCSRRIAACLPMVPGPRFPSPGRMAACVTVSDSV